MISIQRRADSHPQSFAPTLPPHPKPAPTGPYSSPASPTLTRAPYVNHPSCPNIHHTAPALQRTSICFATSIAGFSPQAILETGIHLRHEADDKKRDNASGVCFEGWFLGGGGLSREGCQEVDGGEVMVGLVNDERKPTKERRRLSCCSRVHFDDSRGLPRIHAVWEQQSVAGNSRCISSRILAYGSSIIALSAACLLSLSSS